MFYIQDVFPNVLFNMEYTDYLDINVVLRNIDVFRN